MTDDISRRDLVKGAAIGAAATVIAIPTVADMAMAHETPRVDKLEVAFQEIRALLAEQKPEDISDFMMAPYYHIFKAHAELERSDWIRPVALAYAITRKDVMDGVALSTAKESLKGLWSAYRDIRDAEAARIFNNPYTRHDGRDPLLSVTKGNTFCIPIDLNRTSLEEAIERIKASGSAPYVLLVPRALQAVGERLTKQELGSFEEPLISRLIVWDGLTNPDAWFVLTQTDGFRWPEREAFEMDAWKDNITGNILIKAYERRGFICDDHKAVFGSAPAAPYCSQYEKVLDRYSLRNDSQVAGLVEFKSFTL